jgi:hypothetical protein
VQSLQHVGEFVPVALVGGLAATIEQWVECCRQRCAIATLTGKIRRGTGWSVADGGEPRDHTIRRAAAR